MLYGHSIHRSKSTSYFAFVVLSIPPAATSCSRSGSSVEHARSDLGHVAYLCSQPSYVS